MPDISAGLVLRKRQKFLVLRSIPILQWDFTLRHYLSPVSYHIRSFRQIRSSLDDAIAASVASALVSSRLHQMNIVLYGTALKHTGHLQRVQHALARVVVNHRSCPPFSSNELLKQLHWLPLQWSIQFKLATLTFKALHTGRPPYLTDLFQHHQPTRSLRSSSSHQLFIPRHNLSFRSRAFRFSAPRTWNSLPLRIRETQSLPAFKRYLKTHFSQSAYLTPTHHPTRPDSLIDFGVI